MGLGRESRLLRCHALEQGAVADLVTWFDYNIRAVLIIAGFGVDPLGSLATSFEMSRFG